MKKEAMILLEHGAGGTLMHALIEEEILPRFHSEPLSPLSDAATLPGIAEGVLFASDAFVVQPPLFPGGSIGELAVYGTVNDLAVAGGTPLWLSLNMILEEGLPFKILRKILDDIALAAKRVPVTIATGDTKVVPKGECDKIYLSSSGIAAPIPWLALDKDHIRPGDHILVSGTLGEHGLAILAARENFGITGTPESDSDSIYSLVKALKPLGEKVRFMRDPTRGGLASVMAEIVKGRDDWGVVLHEADLPFSPAAYGLSEQLGLDLLHMASEGRLVLFCAPEASQEILNIWQRLTKGKRAAIIGAVQSDYPGRTVLKTRIGGARYLTPPRGELLPRIC
ncbi:hydrogenase expression/formation protein HypE [Magnetococcales bacterium HHB-1]